MPVRASHRACVRPAPQDGRLHALEGALSQLRQEAAEARDKARQLEEQARAARAGVVQCLSWRWQCSLMRVRVCVLACVQGERQQERLQESRRWARACCPLPPHH